MDDPEMRWFWILGRVFGGFVGVLTFFGCWIAAFQSWGWLLGLAFGWLPALIIAIMAGCIAWALWGLLWLFAIVGFGWWFIWGRHG
jgi:hypothetical protein